MKEQDRVQTPKPVLIENLTSRVLRDRLMPKVHRLVRGPELSEEFWQRFRKLISEGGWPVVFANHQSHVDILALAVLTRRLVAEIKMFDSEFKGFRLPVATSLQTGHQGNLLQFIYEKIPEQVAAWGIFPVPVTRKKDRVEYGIKGGNWDSLVSLAQAREEGFGIAIFPEGTVQGGRRRGPGWENIHGLQKVGDDLLTIKEHVRQAFFVPVGINGGFRVFNPGDRRPPWKAVAAGVLAVLHLPTFKLIEIKVGRPITSDEVPDLVVRSGRACTPDEINTLLMRKVAELLPPHAQGVYRNIEATGTSGIVYSK